MLLRKTRKNILTPPDSPARDVVTTVTELSRQKHELLFSPKRTEGLWGPPRPLGCTGFYPGIKRPRRELRHSLPPSCKVKNEWNFTSTSPICRHGVEQDNFAFYLAPAAQPSYQRHGATWGPKRQPIDSSRRPWPCRRPLRRQRRRPGAVNESVVTPWPSDLVSCQLGGQVPPALEPT